MINALIIAVMLVSNVEDFRETAYLCPAGVLTIGYGLTGPTVTKSSRTTRKEATGWLKTRLQQEMEFILDAVGKDRVLLDFELAALASFVYNVGRGAFSKSTLLKKLKAQAPADELVNEFKKWDKANGVALAGLTKRRDMEATLFIGNCVTCA